MRKVIHCAVYFSHSDKEKIINLMKYQSSALRRAYQGIRKHKLPGNKLKKHVKVNYMKYLNQRYIADACILASSISRDNVIFGGKRAWKKLNTGNLSKEDWQKIRNSQLYSRGDRSKKGNPNIRVDVSGKVIYVNDPEKRGCWISGKLFIPSKYKEINTSCYDCRLIYKNDKFTLNISYEVPPVEEIVYGTKQGVIGLDVNPSEVALAEINSDGNLVKHFQIKYPRIAYGGYHKRNNDIRLLAKEIVNYALLKGKSIIVEDLEFNQKKKSKHKKFNRMRHNFCYRKILEAIESRAKRYGVRLIKVNPAFSSILGNIKYSHLYSLNRHTGAALVIGRRGMGLKERDTFKIFKGPEGKLNLEGRYLSSQLTAKAFKYLREFLNIEETVLTGLGLDVITTRGPEAGGSPAGQSAPRTGRSSDSRMPELNKEQETEVSAMSGQ